MAEEYIRYPIENDPVRLVEEWIAEIRAYFPNFDPPANSLSLRGASALVQIISEGLYAASNIPDEIFRQVCVNLHNIPSIVAEPARAKTTWTARDEAGYEPVATGTVVSVNGVLFETMEEVLFPSRTRIVREVIISALRTGEESNNLGAPGGLVELEEPSDYVQEIRLEEVTAGGVEEEALEAYLTRAKTRLALSSEKAIKLRDLSELAQTVVGVDLATAIKGYNPETRTYENDGTASVAVRSVEAREAISGLIREAVRTLLLGPEERLINNALYIIDPTWTRVDITFEAIAFPGAEPEGVRTAALEAVRLLAEPSRWGLPQTGQSRIWANKTIFSRYDVAQALGEVEGLDRVERILIGLAGGRQEEADARLEGVAPLPLPGRIEGTVRAP